MQRSVFRHFAFQLRMLSERTKRALAVVSVVIAVFVARPTVLFAQQRGVVVGTVRGDQGELLREVRRNGPLTLSRTVRADLNSHCRNVNARH